MHYIFKRHLSKVLFKKALRRNNRNKQLYLGLYLRLPYELYDCIYLYGHIMTASMATLWLRPWLYCVPTAGPHHWAARSDAFRLGAAQNKTHPGHPQRLLGLGRSSRPRFTKWRRAKARPQAPAVCWWVFRGFLRNALKNAQKKYYPIAPSKIGPIFHFKKILNKKT